MTTIASFLAEPEGDEPWFIDDRDRDPRDEFARQLAVLREGRKQCPAVRFTAIPNARKGSDWERIRRWREGAVAGALDLFATWRGCAGPAIAFMEMKNGREMPGQDQRDYLNMLYRQGFPCGVFRREDSVMAFLRQCGAPFIDQRRRLL